MIASRKYWPLASLVWTLITFASSLLLLGLTLGDAAWNGINFVLGLYLFLNCAGSLGLIFGCFAAYSEKRALARIAFFGASVVAGLSTIFALGFIFGRTSGVPLNDPFYFFGVVKVPILGFYAFVAACGAIEAVLYFPKTKKPRPGSFD